MKTILHGKLYDVRNEGEYAQAILKSDDGLVTLLYLKPVGLNILKGYEERSYTVRVKGWNAESVQKGNSFYVTNLTGYFKVSA
ncbi:hypothetical protein MY04_3872 [Flammeovirga sp. MY04]|uniref:hypothetical protein n=1 Tax=Flammeovirga sp. MY04 TaxID=1191459 RepID=UPI0008061C7E|nr:hypothetical protein [Flammeovirga sp. MY04]ANQ51216.1 hypothetical protein MY04_3872 [Flammeovirga sp. MY04]